MKYGTKLQQINQNNTPYNKTTVPEKKIRPERMHSPHSYSHNLLLACIFLPFLITVEPKSFQQATNQNGIAANCFIA
jgi:hypothetical protein